MMSIVREDGDVLLGGKFDLVQLLIYAVHSEDGAPTILATSFSVPGAMTTLGVGGDKFDHRTV